MQLPHSFHSSFPSVSPRNFHVSSSTSILYILDNSLYRVDLCKGPHPEISGHEQQRSYQAVASSPKHNLTVLADYGKVSRVLFNNCALDVCPLDIHSLEISLDGKYVAVLAGDPTKALFIVDVNKQQVHRGVSLADPVLQAAFDPANARTLALLYADRVEIYRIAQRYEVDGGEVRENTFVQLIGTVKGVQPPLQYILWDQQSNIYICNGTTLVLYSLPQRRILLSNEEQQSSKHLSPIVCLSLTLKHIIIFHSAGQIQFLLRYTPQSEHPLTLDKSTHIHYPITHAAYSHHYTHLFFSHSDGFFSFVHYPAQTNEVEEEDGDRTHQKETSFTLSPTRVGPFHYQPIVFVKILANTLLSVSKMGRVIIHDLNTRHVVGYNELNAEVQCCDVYASTLAVGFADGHLRFYGFGGSMRVVKQFLLSKTNDRITKCRYSRNGGQLVASCTIQGEMSRLYYVLTAEEQYEVLGYVVMRERVEGIAFSPVQKPTPRHELLQVQTTTMLVLVNGPSATVSRRRGRELELQCEMYGCKVEENGVMWVMQNGDVLIGGQEIKRYKAPTELWKGQVKKGVVVEVGYTECGVSAMGQGVVAGRQGCVVLYTGGSYSTTNTNTNQWMHGWKKEMISCVSRSERWVVTGSIEGSIRVIGEWSSNNLQAGVAYRVSDSVNIVHGAVPYFQDSIEQEYLLRTKESIQAKKRVKLQKIGGIREALRQLLTENERQEQLQRLPRDDFAIDLPWREQSLRRGQVRCAQIREQSRRRILYDEVYARRLKELTYGRMAVQLRAINGLKSNTIVFNFQLRRVSEEERRRVQLVMNLRRNQRKEEWGEVNRNVVNGGVVQALIMGQYEVKSQKKDEKVKKKKEDEQPTIVEVQEVYFEEEWSLLYSAMELYSANARRNQMVLLQHMILRIKESFNKEFEKAVKLRQAQHQLIMDKNKRIEEICEQLKRVSEGVRVRGNVLESVEVLLEVVVPFERHLNREERQRQGREREREEQRLKMLAEDDASQRALHKMMGGTLQEKKVSILEVQVEREKWMDKPVEEMSEEEKGRFKEYEVRKIKNEEEKERIVKKLEVQLRKLHLEIQEIICRYDERLFNLARRRIEYEYRIAEEELYCCRLQMGLCGGRRVVGEGVVEREGEIAGLVERCEVLRGYGIVAPVEPRKVGDVESRLKTIEKSVFEEYHTNGKKQREMEEKLLEGNGRIRELLVVLDPYRELQSRALREEIEQQFSFFVGQIRALGQELGIAEGVLLGLLQGRFKYRLQVQEYGRRQAMLEYSVGELERELARVRGQLQGVRGGGQVERDEGCDVLVRLRQGQVQLGGEGPLVQLGDALLTSRLLIEQLNRSIVERAGEKIAVMEEIKKCKIQVTEETLNMEKKNEMIEHFGMLIREIQLLKVKKEMQRALRGQRVDEEKSLREQIDKVRMEGEKRVRMLEDKIRGLERESEGLERENKALETQKWTLENTVRQREKIKEMMSAQNAEGEGEGEEKFEQIAVNRKLFDKAKEQTEEIELLREELSKLKAKTFANFSNVQK